MSRIQRWDVIGACVRPAGVDGEDVCGGEVRCHGYADPGQYSGPPESCYPPEGESACDPCATCGYDDWSDDEIDTMTARALPDHDSDPRAEPEYGDDR